MDDKELLSQAIEASGLSARQFAMVLLARDERTIRRWLAGDPMPDPAKIWCAKWLEMSDRQRDQVVKAFTA